MVSFITLSHLIRSVSPLYILGPTVSTDQTYLLVCVLMVTFSDFLFLFACDRVKNSKFTSKFPPSEFRPPLLNKSTTAIYRWIFFFFCVCVSGELFPLHRSPQPVVKPPSNPLLLHPLLSHQLTSPSLSLRP